MSEWLTTGQMIDQLKIGESAKSNDSKFYIYRDEGGIYFPECHENIMLNDDFLGEKWSIIPKYVSFEEATDALRESKFVKFHIDENNEVRMDQWTVPTYVLEHYDLTWKDLIEGKWSIENKE